MPFCEQFIFTVAKTKHEKGYQVIAKSPGINKEIISECENYLYPVDINLNKFIQSRSLILLKKNIVAFSIVKNIGVGFDGRLGTIYSHTFVIEKKEFQKLDNDSRIFEQYYHEDPSFLGEMPKLILKSEKIPIDFKNVEKIRSILPTVLVALFKNEKIAIFKTNKPKLIQTILSIAPPSVRLIPFSTYVEHPSKQPKYNFILTSKAKLFDLEDDFWKIDLEEKKIPVTNTSSMLGNSIRYLLDLIDKRKENELVEIYNMFEKISSNDFKNKIILVTNYTQFNSPASEKHKQRYADNIFTIINKFDKKIASQYLEKVKNYSNKYAILGEKIQEVINPDISLIDALVLLPVRVTADLISSYVEFQKKLWGKDRSD